MIRRVALPILLALVSCSEPPRQTESAPPPPPPSTPASLLASHPTWGNTEGPAFDSKGTFYFCARGKFKGIVAYTEKDGPREYLAIDAINGPGGLWIDPQDNIFVTGPGEHKVWKVDPKKKVTVLAENFEPPNANSRGPNDIVVAPNRSVYFTTPNGFYGDAPAGSVYRITPDGKVTLFDNSIIGPNGITIAQDGSTLYVAGNTGKATSKITRLALKEDGSLAAKSDLATVENCVADGMDIDSENHVWLTCYSYGTAYRISPQGAVTEQITTDQKALTNCFFGRGADRENLYLTSSDMARETGYVYRAKTRVPGFR